MKPLFKYIFALFLVCYFTEPIQAQKKHKTKTIAAKTVTKKKTNSSKKKQAKKSNKKKSANKGPQFDEAANLNAILKNADFDVKAVKADSIPEKVVTILSAFKPQLKNVAKISFDKANAQTDTTTLALNYQVPSQNLTFQYKPISLIPRAYKADSLFKASDLVTLKIGYGNFFHQFIDLKLNLEDAYNNMHSFNINNESIEGNHHLQTVRNLGFNYLGDIFINKENRIETKLFYNQSQRYRYGSVPDASQLPPSNYKQNYYHTGLALGWLNTNQFDKPIHFLPTLQLEHFEGFGGATNNWIAFNSPMSTKIKTDIKLNFDLSYNFNQYNLIANNHQNNYLIRFDPSVEFNKLNSIIKLGVSPSIVNSEFKLYPSIEFKKKLTDTNYILIAGWQTKLFNNQYTTLAMFNPWIIAPTTIEMTSNDQKFVEIQINAGKRLDYGFRFSLNEYKNLPLFTILNGTTLPKYGLFYQSLFEKKAATIELEAHLRYQFSEQLFIQNQFKYIQFNSLQDNSKPWGILPLELNSNLSWMPNKNWSIDGGLKYWTGATIEKQPGLPYDLKNSLILNAGFSYKLTPTWKAWFKGENLLDKPYERWGEYPSLGVQLIAGVVYSFTK